MKITRVIFKKPEEGIKPIAVCDIVLEDCLRVVDIKLFRKKGEYYLVLPSKQDIYQSVAEVNKGVELHYPSVFPCSGGKPCGKYEEFYYPVNKEFYRQLLKVVVDGYKKFRSVHQKSQWTYVPVEDGGCNGKEERNNNQERKVCR